MKTSRRSHPKTRTGCRVCKVRKVKCDEKKPSCTNCLKHSVQCDYNKATISPGALASPVPETHSPHIYESSSSGTTNTYANSGPGPSADHSISLNSRKASNLNTLDLELLHYYSTSTSFTLSANPIIKTVWRINVPELGFSHHFVLRGILALSALHVARFKPEKKDFYVTEAMLQHQAALQIAVPMLSNISPENCSALYIFSALTCIFALGSPRKPGDLLLVGETGGIPEWLFLLRGTKSIMQHASQALLSGTLAPIFSTGARRQELRAIVSNESLNKPFAELRTRINGACAADQHTARMYAVCIDELHKSFNVVYESSPQNYEMTDAFIWAYVVSDDFLATLREPTQEALAIFAYFCVLLKRLDACWWMEGWSTHLVSQIYSLLDEEHKIWIRWPIEEIGWIPS